MSVVFSSVDHKRLKARPSGMPLGKDSWRMGRVLGRQSTRSASATGSFVRRIGRSIWYATSASGPGSSHAQCANPGPSLGKESFVELHSSEGWDQLIPNQ